MKDLTREWIKAAIEKCFKAVIEEYQISQIKTHNLEFLYSLVKKITLIKINVRILTELDSLYIDSRYPGSMGLLPEGKPSSADVKLFYQTATHPLNSPLTIHLSPLWNAKP